MILGIRAGRDTVEVEQATAVSHDTVEMKQAAGVSQRKQQKGHLSESDNAALTKST